MLDVLQQRLGEQFGLKPRSGWEQQIRSVLQERSEARGSGRAAPAPEPFSSAQDLRELAGRLTVEESYFYRHEAHFDQLVEHVADRARAGKEVRIWSAGCAGGEEPYTVSIVLQERLGKRVADNIQILASDVNREAIERAQAGIFRRWSFRSTADGTRDRYFHPHAKKGSHDPGELVLCEELRQRVRFSHLSIQEHLSLLPADSLDAILFRNVAVYLDPEAVSRIYDGFAKVLRPGGIVLVSASDPRPQSVQLQSGARGNGTVYTLVSAEPLSRPPRLATPHAPRPATQHAVTPMTERPSAPDTEALVRKARTLADRGQYAPALSLCNEAIGAQGGQAAAYQLRGQLCFHQGRYRDSVADLGRACELASRDVLARFWYTLALQAHGQAADGLRQCLRLLDQLSAQAGDTVLSDGHTTVAELASAAEALRRTLA